MKGSRVISGLSLRIVGAVSAFLINVCVVRFLGIDNSGEFFYILTLSSAFSAAFTFGFYNLIQSKHQVLSVRLFSSYVQLAVCLFPILFLLLLLTGRVLDIELYTVLIAAFSCVPLSIISVYAGCANRVGLHVKSVFYQNIAVQVIFLGLLLTANALEGNLDVRMVGAIYLVSAYLSVTPCLSGFSYKKISLKFCRYAFYSSLPFFTVIVSAQLYMWGVNFTSIYSLSKADYSALVVIQRIAFVIAIIVSVIDAAASPSFNAAYRSRADLDLKVLMKKYTFASACLGVIAFTCLFFLGSLILSLFSSDLLAYKSELIIVCSAQLVNCLTGPTGSFLMMTGSASRYKNLVLVNSVVTILASLPAGLYYGIHGVAVVVLTSALIQNGLSALYIKLKYGFITFAPLGLQLKGGQ